MKNAVRFSLCATLNCSFETIVTGKRLIQYKNYWSKILAASDPLAMFTQCVKVT